MSTVITKQEVIKKVNGNVTTCYNGLRFLLSLQTIGERQSGTTKYRNGVGFKAKYPTEQRGIDDSRIWRDDHRTAEELIEAAGGDPVENWKAAHRLLAIQLLLGPNGRGGYLRQLTAWANKVTDPDGVSEFKLSALYDEGTRTHKNYVAQQLGRDNLEAIRQRIAAIESETASIRRGFSGVA